MLCVVARNIGKRELCSVFSLCMEQYERFEGLLLVAIEVFSKSYEFILDTSSINVSRCHLAMNRHYSPAYSTAVDMRTVLCYQPLSSAPSLGTISRHHLMSLRWSGCICDPAMLTTIRRLGIQRRSSYLLGWLRAEFQAWLSC